jgi:polyphosphate kinase 2 (PPK2 family)
MEMTMGGKSGKTKKGSGVDSKASVDKRAAPHCEPGALRQGLRPRTQEAARRAGETAAVGGAKGLKVVIVFEGAMGRQGRHHQGDHRARQPARVPGRGASAPTEREKSQMYMQRYLPHLPAAGEVVIFDRSWYNRAGVERVMDFCHRGQAQAFLKWRRSSSS